MAFFESIWAFHHATSYLPPQCLVKLHPYGHKSLSQVAIAVWFYKDLVFTVNGIAVESPHKLPGLVGLVEQCWVVGTAFGELDLNLNFATYQLYDFQQVTEL